MFSRVLQASAVMDSGRRPFPRRRHGEVWWSPACGRESREEDDRAVAEYVVLHRSRSGR
jgi:hypothetical protein